MDRVGHGAGQWAVAADCLWAVMVWGNYAAVRGQIWHHHTF